MAAPIVVVLESIHRAGIDRLAALCTVVQLTGPGDPQLADALARADALIVRSTRVTAEMIAAAPNLRVIGRHGAGTDNIDLDAATSRGVTVVNTPRSNTESVAEYVITVALMMLKRIDEVSSALRSGEFTAENGSLPGQVDRAGLVGREAAGARIGLVGAGAIGRAVASRAQALGMTVIAYDPFVAPETLALGIEFAADLDTLLASVDIVSLHVPGGSGPLITAEKLALMQSGSLLINAARGELVDADALAEALRSGQLAGAAVDVFDPEPPTVDSTLFAAPHLITTPHMAAMTREALVRMSADVAAGVLAALDKA
ncbi:hydroxyacid dehydrogenase [Microbacterium sp.]|uniref:hydroxyacid dehydrogenase n=1 Tax=Microbacterium sp. TaxID=51671 RepID=UPI0028B018FC|nr:hydroxyacid dehydrogenase [Microbacterium sp.]